jgi:shikimate dehydrogenase
MPQRITGHTEVIGLIAQPIRHSKSPMMHNTAFEALGLDYVYVVFEVGHEGLEEAVKGARALGLKGFNVSMPNKRAIIPYLDEILPAAQLCQAVNTVVNDHGKLIGTNTDGAGYFRACREAGFDLTGKKMTLLGAGGAATSIAMQAGLEGVGEVSIFNRQDEFWPQAVANAEKLNRETGCKANVFPLEDQEILRREINSSVLLANATSAGFGDQKGCCPIPDASFLRPDLVVTDLIYIPDQTKLLEMAAQVGCKTMNGLGMMIYQGAIAFQLWTGKEMPIEAVKGVL